MSNAKHQAAYRARQSEKMMRRTEALEAILAKVDGKTGPVAIEIRKIVEEALS